MGGVILSMYIKLYTTCIVGHMGSYVIIPAVKSRLMRRESHWLMYDIPLQIDSYNLLREHAIVQILAHPEACWWSVLKRL